MQAEPQGDGQPQPAQHRQNDRHAAMVEQITTLAQTLTDAQLAQLLADGQQIRAQRAEPPLVLASAIHRAYRARKLSRQLYRALGHAILGYPSRGGYTGKMLIGMTLSAFFNELRQPDGGSFRLVSGVGPKGVTRLQAVFLVQATDVH